MAISLYRPKHRVTYRSPGFEGGTEYGTADCKTGRGDCWGVYGSEHNGCPQCDPIGYIPTHRVKARCYMEFCCNTATHEVIITDRSGTGRTPIPWGWCWQHVPAPISADRADAFHNFGVTR